jgi:small nuclear ribonucleoprotein (snRNP)-like protein
MKKCPNCGYEEHKAELMTFDEFMDLTIKRVSKKQMKEYGYGQKNNQRSKKAR